MGWTQCFISENVVCSMQLLSLVFKTDIDIKPTESNDISYNVLTTSLEEQNLLQYFKTWWSWVLVVS